MNKLEFAEKHETAYCIPIWLRDEQIKQAIKKVRGRIQAHETIREEPIAVVGFGPSLKDTWEQVRDFKYIITSSGAHRFLIDRGIIPTWHVEVDPREHKIQLLGEPHPDVTYLPASTCHPKYFDHLANNKVELWHIFSNEEQAYRVLPRDEWALTGGPDVGMRAMAIARFFGFVEQHVFGIDGCVGREKESHASRHPNAPAKLFECEYPSGSGRIYVTTPGLLECAKAMVHELEMLKDVKATFYGTGLVKVIVENSTIKPAKVSNLGIITPGLISTEYRELNSRLHNENLTYGVGGGRHADRVIKLTESLGSKSVLDYGAGKGYLAKALPFPIWEYDPAIPGKDELPRPADLVICTDVLEHIEPDKIMLVLDDLRRCVKKVGYFTINMGPAKKTLADGRNTHLIQKDKDWWVKQLKKFFVIGKVFERGIELIIVVGPKEIKLDKAA